MLISNTSTLILLAKVDMLRIVLDDVGHILIPNVVYEELRQKESFEVLLIKNEMDNKRIEVVTINKKYYENILRQFKLDEGEAATYALFKKKDGKGILTDDGELIKLCKIEGIPFMIAMAIVVKMHKKKKLKKEEALGKLSKLYGYGRYSEDIYEYFKSEVK